MLAFGRCNIEQMPGGTLVLKKQHAGGKQGDLLFYFCGFEIVYDTGLITHKPKSSLIGGNVTLSSLRARRSCSPQPPLSLPAHHWVHPLGCPVSHSTGGTNPSCPGQFLEPPWCCGVNSSDAGTHSRRGQVPSSQHPPLPSPSPLIATAGPWVPSFPVIDS